MEKRRLRTLLLIFCCLLTSGKIKNNVYPVSVMEEIKEFVKSLESRRAQEESQLKKHRKASKKLYYKALELSHLCHVNCDSNNALIEYLGDPQGEFPAAITDFERLLTVYQPYLEDMIDNQEFDGTEQQGVVALFCRYLCPVYKPQLDQYIPVLHHEKQGMKHKKSKEAQES